MHRMLSGFFVCAALVAPFEAKAQGCPEGWFCEEGEPPRPPGAVEPEGDAPETDAAESQTNGAGEEAPANPGPTAPQDDVSAEPPGYATVPGQGNASTEGAASTPAEAPAVGVAEKPAVEVGSEAPVESVVKSEPSAPPPEMVLTPEGDSQASGRWRMSGLRKFWGINAHVATALVDDGTDGHDPSLRGFGVAGRYRLLPHFALEGALDLFFGADWNGYDRAELALSFGGQLFFNPKSRVQVYLPMGVTLSGARVDVEAADGVSHRERYRYFGVYTGLGTEIRLGNLTALDVDLIGFLRSRTDREARLEPEFVEEETGYATNTSGGGLLRLGMSFYWL